MPCQAKLAHNTQTGRLKHTSHAVRQVVEALRLWDDRRVWRFVKLGVEAAAVVRQPPGVGLRVQCPLGPAPAERRRPLLCHCPGDVATDGAAGARPSLGQQPSRVSSQLDGVTAARGLLERQRVQAGLALQPEFGLGQRLRWPLLPDRTARPRDDRGDLALVQLCPPWQEMRTGRSRRGDEVGRPKWPLLRYGWERVSVWGRGGGLLKSAYPVDQREGAST